MANLFQFSTTSPGDGEIRAFVKDAIDGTKIVRALTVDNNSLDGRSIVPTLQSIQSLNFRLTGSGDFSNFQRITVTQKASYFFIDNVDLSLADVSSSLSSSVTFDPFIARSFDNDDYNALISNATEFRPSKTRYVLERSSLDPFPTNFEAALGIETRNLFLNTATTGSNPMPTSLVFNLDNQLYYTGSAVSFPNDEDITLTITRDELIKATKGYQEMFKTGPIPPAVGQTRSLNFFLQLVVDKEPEMNSPNTVFQTILGAGWRNGSWFNTTISPVHRTIASGSAAGSSGGGTSDTNFYARLDMIISRQFPNMSGTISDNFTILPDILSIDKTQNFITLRYHKNLPGSSTYQAFPYAIPASVPDSNYTATGFSNGRYNGSKTNANDYGGIEPALTAKTITILPLIDGPISSSFDLASGSYARSWANMNFLLSGQSGSDGERAEYVQQYEQIAFSGLRDQPDVSVGVVAEFYSSSTAITPDLLTSNTDTSFDITTAGYGDRIQVGDLVQFTSGSGGAARTESVIITSKNTKTNPLNGKNFVKIFNLTAIRGQGPDGLKVNAHDPTKLGLTLKQGDRLITIEGTKIIPQQQLRAVLNPEKVKDSPDDMIIVETDFKGFIINAYTSGSQDGA